MASFFPAWQCGLGFIFLSFVFTHFVAFWRDLDDELKTLSDFERHSAELILRAPAVILEAVENHFVPAVKSGVHVHGDVAVLARVTTQVDDEPAEARESQSVSLESEKLESSF